MNDNRLIIAVAKLDGKCPHNRVNSGNHPEEGFMAECLDCGVDFPVELEYLTSHDAIIPVIEKVCNTKHLKEEFVCYLTLELDDTEHFSLLDVFSAITKTTPKQLSIALVKACEKWEEA